MIDKKFVFAVKLEEFQNIYEVFDIHFVPSQYEDMFKRWSDGFSNNDVQVINISDLTPTPKTIEIGSVWDGKNFITKNVINTIELSEHATCYAFLDTNKTVFGVHFIKKIHQFYDEKWKAAMTLDVIGLDATDYPEVNLGYLWDGNNFYPSESN